MTIEQRVKQLEDQVKILMDLHKDEIPAPIAPPVPVLPIDPEPVAPKCPVEIANGVKWKDHKATIAVDRFLSAADKRWIQQGLDQTIEWVHENSSLELTQNNALQKRARIFITKKEIDGWRKTLGRALQWILRGFFNRTVIELDTADMRNISIRIPVLKHELGHVFGIPHPTDETIITLLSAIFRGVRDFGEYETLFISKLYPKKEQQNV